jgi:hypothetical protein
VRGYEDHSPSAVVAIVEFYEVFDARHAELANPVRVPIS